MDGRGDQSRAEQGGEESFCFRQLWRKKKKKKKRPRLSHCLWSSYTGGHMRKKDLLRAFLAYGTRPWAAIHMVVWSHSVNWSKALFCLCFFCQILSHFLMVTVLFSLPSPLYSWKIEKKRNNRLHNLFWQKANLPLEHAKMGVQFINRRLSWISLANRVRGNL